MTQTGVPDNFATRTGFPTPLEAGQVDDCGNFISNGFVGATFSNSDPGIGMEPIGYGRYVARWVPSHPSDALPGDTVSVELQGYAPPLAPAFTDAIGSVTADTISAIHADGIVNNLNAQAGAPAAPGAVIQICGPQFGSETTPGAIQNGQLSKALNGVSVAIGGLDASLYYSSAGQINAQVPVELPPTCNTR